MPLYEYQCDQCGYRYEKIQKFDADPEHECPKCGGELHRPLTAPALQFKGAGWYVNDYASKGASAKTEKPASESGTSGTESKPAAQSKPAATESAAKAAVATSSSSSTSSNSTS